MWPDNAELAARWECLAVLHYLIRWYLDGQGQPRFPKVENLENAAVGRPRGRPQGVERYLTGGGWPDSSAPEACVGIRRSSVPGQTTVKTATGRPGSHRKAG